MKKLRVLILGSGLDIIMALPPLFKRAGFEVDLISDKKIFKKSRFVDNLDIAPRDKFIEICDKKNLEIYDFIAPCDDETLELILHSNLTQEKKLKLLPVTCSKGFEHIFSKIALSKILSKAGILTPEFLVACNIEEAKKAAEILTYPLMLKIDSSNGGRGVLELCGVEDFEKIPPNFFAKPILVQKKIIGTELDLSAIYRDEKLIFFTYSKIQKVIANKFGPSVLRLYSQLANVDEQLFLQMQNLGRALNANGFVNISCIETADKKIYFFECDMRPNSWVGFSRFFGDDAATKIANWFAKKDALSYPLKLNKKYPPHLILPFFERMWLKEILQNKYQVWKYLPYGDYQLLFFILREKFVNEGYKIPKIDIKILYKKIKRMPLKIIRTLVSERENRAEIRNKILWPYSKVLMMRRVVVDLWR